MQYRNPENQINGRIQQYLERMHRTRIEVFDESNRKRPAPTEPTDGLDQAKRQRVVAETATSTQSIPPLPAGDVSWRQLYTLNPEGSTVNFDVQAFKDPEQLLRIVVPVLQSVDAQKLDHAINVRETTLFPVHSSCGHIVTNAKPECLSATPGHVFLGGCLNAQS